MLASNEVEEPLARLALAAQQALHERRDVRQQHAGGEAVRDLVLDERGEGRRGGAVALLLVRVEGEHREHARHDGRRRRRVVAQRLEEARQRVLAVLPLLRAELLDLRDRPGTA